MDGDGETERITSHHWLITIVSPWDFPECAGFIALQTSTLRNCLSVSELVDFFAPETAKLNLMLSLLAKVGNI